MLVVLLYLRHNLAQALLAELFDCSQPTVSRLICRLTPAITTVLTPNAEQVAARGLRSTVRVDGFLAPTGDRRKDTYTSGMYSGKRHRCGFNIHLERAVDTAGGQEAFDATVGKMLNEVRGWRLADMRKRRGLTQEQVAFRKRTQWIEP